MSNISPYGQLAGFLASGDIVAARQLLVEHPELISLWGREALVCAAEHDRIESIALLVDFGADIHAGRDNTSPEGVIDRAACDGAVNAVRWLLEHGAAVNHVVDGVTRCFPLTGAAFKGHLDVVKLLVERGGADVNATWAGQNALSMALMYNQHEVATYLRSVGAREPWELAPDGTEEGHAALLKHITKHLGRPDPLALREVVPGNLPVAVHVIRRRRDTVLATVGMSDRPMTVPAGGEDFRFAELVLHLPGDWPLTPEALADPAHGWPVEWLRRVARYPHEHGTWLGGRAAVIANGDPPEPLGPNTRQTCLLAVTEAGRFGRAELPDGRGVQFYTVVPLYTEERDLEAAKGTPHLIKLLMKHDIDFAVDIMRANVALLSGKKRRGGEPG